MLVQSEKFRYMYLCSGMQFILSRGENTGLGCLDRGSACFNIEIPVEISICHCGVHETAGESHGH